MRNLKKIEKIFDFSQSIFQDDYNEYKVKFSNFLKNSSILVIGGAGSIGSAVVKELLNYNINKIHILDINENSLVEVIRDIRSTQYDLNCEIKTFVIDITSLIFESFLNYNHYDFIFNFAAVKHVRSDRDIFTLQRLITVNILASIKISEYSKRNNLNSFFSVSSDKAANPTNFMGASKKIMELFLLNEMKENNIKMARFANVAFSDGSLLDGFKKRFFLKQPFSAPDDIRRYFINHKEAAHLCILACLSGENGNIFFPKKKFLNALTFKEIAIEFLKINGFEAYICQNEIEAIEKSEELIRKNKWPCYFFKSDTSGEKKLEEFATNFDTVIDNKFSSVEIIDNKNFKDITSELDLFINDLNDKILMKNFNKKDLFLIFKKLIKEFTYNDKNFNLDQRM